MQSPADGLVAFLNASPTAFHAVAESARQLRAAGFQELSERQPWSIVRGGLYYFTRGGSTVVAFAVGACAAAGGGFMVIGAHTDSPCPKLKPVSATSKSGFQSVGVEPYGGGIWATWFDRDLGVAGRVLVRQPDGSLRPCLVNVTRPVLRIPSLAIHLNREVNSDGFKVNAQTHLPPVLATTVKAELLTPKKAEGASAEARHHPLLLQLFAEQLGCAAEDICDFDAQLCDVQPATLGGACDEFVFSGRLDNLASCYTSLQAFIAASTNGSLAQESAVRMLAHFDHEEVGSASAHGAASPVMIDAVRRVAAAMAGGEEGAVERALRASFLVSADMAHGVHPNYADKHEPCHAPRFHGGLVVKHNSNQRYATDSVTAFLFRELGRAAGVPVQEFVVRSDLACGSTIGPIISANTGMRCVDVGAPMLSMHSVREMCSADDVGHAIKHFTAVYEGFTRLDAALTLDKTEAGAAD